MKVYRSAMEKILEQQENDLPVTNPKEPFRTALRKLRYRWAQLMDRLFGPKHHDQP